MGKKSRLGAAALGEQNQLKEYTNNKKKTHRLEMSEKKCLLRERKARINCAGSRVYRQGNSFRERGVGPNGKTASGV